MRILEERKKAGEAIWGDLDAVRVHVEQLRQRGMGVAQIAIQAGVGQSTIASMVWNFSKPPRAAHAKVLADVAERILSVRFDVRVISPLTRVDSTGARRRLQALVVAGWPMPVLAEHFGLSRQNFRPLLYKSRYSAGSCVRVIELFEKLWLTDPPKMSGLAASRTRAMVERNGWVGIGAWDDDTIDDPRAEPRLHGEGESVVDDEEVVRVLADRGKFMDLNQGERVALVRAWIKRGGTMTAFSKRFAMSGRVAKRYFEQADDQRGESA